MFVLDHATRGTVEIDFRLFSRGGTDALPYALYRGDRRRKSLTLRRPHLSKHGISVSHGTALYVGAILGTGVLVLPALAAEQAGPASLLAWAGLVLVSIPTALTFSILGARHPNAGGVASFVSRAFGSRVAAVVGWWFYFALPLGVPVGALVGGAYVAEALHGGRAEAIAVAAAILALVFLCNAMGLTLAGRVQIVLMALLVVILVVSIAVSLPDAQITNARPFAPGGLASVGSAAGLLLFSFVGWEAVTHLSAEFDDPRRQLPRITALTLIFVAVLYLSLALTCVLVLGQALSTTSAPLTLLLERGLGEAAGSVTAVAAVLLTFGSLNAYVAGASRLGAALARDGALPSWLAGGYEAGKVPARSLGLLAVLIGSSLLVIALTGAGLDAIIRPPAACYIAVTIAGLLAGRRLLDSRATSAASSLAVVGLTVVLLFTGWALAMPVALGVGALVYQQITGRRPQVMEAAAT